MPSMFVRGNMLSVVNADAHSVSNKGLQTGDTLVVGARKKGAGCGCAVRVLVS